MSQVIDIVSLYPKDMNIYGDSGNVLAIQRRLALYGYEPRVHAYNQGCDWPEHVDMILGGGGQDTGQKKIIDDFFQRADLLRSLAADGVPMLMICGLYQLFGEYFETVDGSRLDGIGVIGAYTVGQETRMIGNLTETSADFGKIIGSENHSGQTFLRDAARHRRTGRHRQQRRGPYGRRARPQRDRHVHARLAAAEEFRDRRFPDPHRRRTPLRHVRSGRRRTDGRATGRPASHRRNRRPCSPRGHVPSALTAAMPVRRQSHRPR